MSPRHFIVLTSSWGQSSISASLPALSLASCAVIMAHGLLAAVDCRIACEKRSLDPGDSMWKATLAEPADSETEEAGNSNLILDMQQKGP